MQRTHYPKWTEGEEEILLEEIGKNPTNLKACFMATAEIIGRTPGAISNRYYTKILKSDKIAVLTLGRHAVVKNKKRLKESESPITILKTVWNKIVKLLFNI